MKSESHSAEPRPDEPRWEFKQNANKRWQWYRGINGHGPGTSKEFDDFGPCLSDAIKNGFRPDTDKYATHSGGRSIDWSRRRDAQQ
jgi:hypothetical protein